MATEPSNLRHLFGETPPPSIDVSSVIRRSRARRAPRVLGAGAFAVLTVGALAYGGFAGLAGFGGGTASDAGGAQPMAESMQSSEDKAAFGEAGSSVSVGELFRCGEPVFEIPPSELGVMLAVRAPTVVDAAAASIPVTVSLRNDSAQRVETTVSATPALALVSGDVVVATTPPGLITTMVDLGAGETFDYETAVLAQSCDGEPVPPGEYELHAAIDITAVSGRPWATGPTQTVTIE